MSSVCRERCLRSAVFGVFHIFFACYGYVIISMTNRPILYYTKTTPTSRAVLMTAAEIGIELDKREVDFRSAEDRSPEFLRMSPQGTIPVLDDNGTIINESNVICMHLTDKYSSNEHLFPEEPNARYLVLSRLFFNCGHLNARLRKIVEPVVWFGSTEIWHEAVQYVRRTYAGLESCLEKGPFLCGQHMTIADLCFITSVSTANDFAPINPTSFPRSVAWMERMSMLPYYKECNQDGADSLRRIVEQKLEENKRAWV